MTEELKTKFKGTSEELIPVLQYVQNKNEYLSNEAMKEIAYFLGIAPSTVYGVATFYAQFRFKPIGKKHIMVCRGTACHVQGAPRILDELENHLGIKEDETSEDGEYSLESVACIGACSLAPCVVENGKVEANLTPSDIAKLFPKKN